MSSAAAPQLSPGRAVRGGEDLAHRQVEEAPARLRLRSGALHEKLVLVIRNQRHAVQPNQLLDLLTHTPSFPEFHPI